MSNGRNILWVDGVNSAVMAHFVLQQIPTALVTHCDLGDSVHEDSHRFINDLEIWYDREIIRLRSEKYANVDEVFEDRHYLAGIHGAPCTGEMKFIPRMNFERPTDTHYWGYTADRRDAKRFKIMQQEYPSLLQRSPTWKM